MKVRKDIEEIMSREGEWSYRSVDSRVMDYAKMMAEVENAIVVVSDVANKSSRIFLGEFAGELGLKDYKEENSIWEKMILGLMTEEELEWKMIAELQFYHFLKTKPKTCRNYYLLTKLQFNDRKGHKREVAHTLRYVYDGQSDRVRYAVCKYSPLCFDFRGKSVIVNSVDGSCEELTDGAGKEILSKRECQVLSLIDAGKKSKEIAEQLHVSVHTVSRHRQEILAKMQVSNSIEACRRARCMNLIG